MLKAASDLIKLLLASCDLRGNCSARKSGFGAAVLRAMIWDLEPLETRTLLSTIIVTRQGNAGAGTLRAAIKRANVALTPVTIKFAKSVTGTIKLRSALPQLGNTTGVIDIEGPGASSLTVARASAFGTPDFGIFTIDRGVDVKLVGLTITGGSASDGGGIVNQGTLTLTSSTVSGNSAISGGGIFNTGTATVTDCTIASNSASVNGGGIDNEAMPTAAVTIKNSIIDSNSAGNSGGGIYSATNVGIDKARTMPTATVTVTDSVIDSDSAGNEGGGIFSNLGTLTISSSTLAHDSANYGGGVYSLTAAAFNSQFGVLTISSSTLAYDAANDNGGGIFNAVGLRSRPSAVTNCTIAHNSAELGGAIFNSDFGDLVAVNDTVAYNTGGGLFAFMGGFTLQNSIIVLNTRVTDGGATPDDIGGFVIGASNMIGVGGSGGLTNGTNGNQVGVTNAGLGELASNGGPTQTIALLAGSPAIDAGTLIPGVTTDQRGIYRPQGPAPDIGAYELQLAPTVVSVQRRGVHFQLKMIIVNFSSPMDTTRAETLANYRIVAAGPDHRFGTGDDRVFPIRSVQYNSTLQSVTLRPVNRLSLHATYRLTVFGTPPGGLADTQGNFLGGAPDREPGTDYVANIDAKLSGPLRGGSRHREIRLML